MKERRCSLLSYESDGANACTLPPTQKWIVADMNLAVLEIILGSLREHKEIHIRAVGKVPSLAEMVLEEVAKHERTT